MEISNDVKLEQDFQSLEVGCATFSVPDNLGSSEVNIQKYKYHSKIKTDLCTFYFKFGYCKFNKNCRFSHAVNGNCNESFKKKSLQFAQFRENITENKKVLTKISGGENSQASDKSSRKTNIQKTCRFFKAGFCTYGSNCFYNHNTNESTAAHRKYGENQNSSSTEKSTSVCYFYARGFCHKNDNCKFLHLKQHSPHNSESITIPSNDFVEQNKIIPQAYLEQNSGEHNLESKKIINIDTSREFKTVNMRNVYELSSLSQDHICLLRDTEIKQMKRRFPNHESVEENNVYTFYFEPSDPDWPFDLKSLLIEVQVPEAYPIEVCKIEVLHNDENIPQLLIKYLNTSITEWLNTRHEDASSNEKVELIFRPFLKWFDRSLEELFINGLRQVKQDVKAKEAGIEYVPPEKLFSSSERCDASNFSAAESESKICTNNDLITKPGVESKSSIIFLKEVNTFDDKVKHFSTNECMKIILQNLELAEGAAALNCVKISLTLRCSRCKTSFNVKSEPKRDSSYKCLKCSKDIGFTLDPSTVHQFSNILGSLYLMSCLPVDINMQECQFLIDCLNCSKQVIAEGVQYGQKHKVWCRFCNQKLIISVESVKFQAAKLSSYTDMKYVPAKKIVKKNKDPGIREGESLPNFGTCKHYKKSYRWLRFPCCGRLYPCDVCHDEKETDHEMKFASRMICGFCSKEQPYSRDKQCFSCSKNVTKKSGCHWEGGKGCRNKIQMSREDKQKYSGTCKTVSKKSQTSKDGKKT